MTNGRGASGPAPFVIEAQQGHSSFVMKQFLRQQLERFPVRLQQLDFFLAQPEVVDDMARYREITREHAEVSEIAGRYQLFLQRDLKAGERRPAVIFFHGGSRRQMLLGWHYMYYPGSCN